MRIGFSAIFNLQRVLAATRAREACFHLL